MINSRRVIAVIGSSRKPKCPKKENEKEKTRRRAGRKAAEEIGKLITDRQEILLTGGKPKAGYEKVNDIAMTAAANEGTAGKSGRLISVRRSGGYDAKPDFKSEYRLLTLTTKLGDARNYINGYVPDVVIAIGGGAGTLTELISALSNNVPIILFGGEVETFEQLKTVGKDEDKKKDLVRIAKEIHKEFNPGFPEDADKLLESLRNNIVEDSTPEAVDQFIRIALERLRQNRVVENTARDAVNRAIDLAKSAKSNHLPPHPGLDQVRCKFDKHLRQLAT